MRRLAVNSRFFWRNKWGSQRDGEITRAAQATSSATGRPLRRRHGINGSSFLEQLLSSFHHRREAIKHLPVIVTGMEARGGGFPAADLAAEEALAAGAHAVGHDGGKWRREMPSARARAWREGNARRP